MNVDTGLPRKPHSWSRKTRLVQTLLLLSLSAGLLQACATINMTATKTNTVCRPWRAITYSGKKDTPQTVEQVQVHNQVGHNLRCWP